MKARIVMLDNMDSFAYNLVDELRQLGYPLVVYRNHLPPEIVISALENYSGPQLLCISPGPGHPTEAGNLTSVLEFALGRLPVLGICLGMQALLVNSGARVDRCHEIVHGKLARINCTPHSIFSGLPNPLPVARYHSLSGYDLGDRIELLATCDDVPMAIYLPAHHALGFQFHPESILTAHGTQLLQQSVEFLLAEASVSEV